MLRFQQPRTWIRVALTSIMGVAVLISQTQADSRIQGKIAAIADGDTVKITRTGGNGPIDPDIGFGEGKPKPRKRDKSNTIRFLGIDTPELHYSPPRDPVIHRQSPHAEKATENLMQLISIGDPVVVVTPGQDNYGRTLGHIFVRDNQTGKYFDVNLKMVEDGWAVPFVLCERPTCSPDYFVRERVAEYAKACINARANKRGIFNPTLPPLKELPYEFRMNLRKEKPQRLVGDLATKKFYFPEVYTKIDPCLRVFFTKLEDARASGFQAGQPGL